MSLDIGSGTKPLLERKSISSDNDDNSSLNDSSDESESEKSSEQSENELSNKNTDTENDVSSRANDDEITDNNNDDNNSYKSNSNSDDQNTDDESEKESSDEGTKNEQESDSDDANDDEELSQDDQKIIQEPTEPKSSQHRSHPSNHSRTQQRRSQSKPPSQDDHQQRISPSRYSTASNANNKNLHDLAMNFKPLPTNSVQVLQDLITTLYEERKQKALSGDFEGSVSIMRAIEHTKEYLNIAEKLAFQRKQKYEVTKENKKVQGRIAEFDQETSRLEKELKKNITKSREKLISDLRKEWQKQEEYWQSEVHMRLYNRPSHKLRALRYQANQMVVCGRFREAEEVMKTANQLQKQEQNQGAYQMQKDYENATKLFDQKVKDVLNTFDTDAVNQIENLRARRATMRTVYQNQEKKVEQRSELVKDADRCWNANMRTIVKEKMSRRDQYPEQMPRTTRALGKSLREKQDKIVLSLPKLNTKKVMENPIPAPNYL